MTDKTILKVTDLKTYFDVTKGLFAPKQIVKAVDGVSFEVKEGQTFGLVGESGCGKSTLGRTIVKLYEPESGTIEFDGKDISKIHGKDLKAFRKDVQMIFQDPYASLNPRMTVGEIIKEPMIIHNIFATDQEREDRVVELLKIVGLKPDHIRRYPHEFSGGQRQRIGIARALAVNPRFFVCDEPISALDVSIQAQIINLLEDIQKEMNLSYLFIAHDISMVKHISDQIGVMYLGHIVESMDAEEIFTNPMHPYTRALLSAVPITDYDVERSRERILLEGEVPSPLHAPAGCPFNPRCPYATEVCRSSMPVMTELENGHKVACHNLEAVRNDPR